MYTSHFWKRPSREAARGEPCGIPAPVVGGTLYAYRLGNAGVIYTLVNPRRIHSWHYDVTTLKTKKLWNMPNPNYSRQEAEGGDIRYRVEDWIEYNLAPAMKGIGRMFKAGYKITYDLQDNFCRELDSLASSGAGCSSKDMEMILLGAFGAIVVGGLCATTTVSSAAASGGSACIIL